MAFNLTAELVHDRHSRSVAAGYSMDLMDEATVVIAGAGALGQNVLLGLALAGVGSLVIVDYDHFEDHNLTRSPLFPDAEVLAETSGCKALGVARSVAHLASASSPSIDAYVGRVELVPARVLSRATVVVSAVDSTSARRWLARWCRIYGVPLVEAGFEGSAWNVSSYGADSGAACYGCLAPEGEAITSCTERARLLAGTGVIPALQTTAAVVGGFVADAVVAHIHGAAPAESRLTHGDVRSPSLRTAAISPIADCGHGHLSSRRVEVSTVPTSWDEVAALIDGRWLLLPSPVVLSAPCPACGGWCAPQVPDHLWQAQPFCNQCVDGGLPLTEGGLDLLDVVELVAGAELAVRLEGVPLAAVGIQPAGALAAMADDGLLEVLELPGCPSPDLRVRG